MEESWVAGGYLFNSAGQWHWGRERSAQDAGLALPTTLDKASLEVQGKLWREKVLRKTSLWNGTSGGCEPLAGGHQRGSSALGVCKIWSALAEETSRLLWSQKCLFCGSWASLGIREPKDNLHRKTIEFRTPWRTPRLWVLLSWRTTQRAEPWHFFGSHRSFVSLQRWWAVWHEGYLEM